MSTGNLGVGGGGEAPFTAKKSPLFGENAFNSDREIHAPPPTKSTISIASAKLGVVRILPFS